MAYWLFKEEPGNYPYDDLVADGGTVWAGVANALARKNLRAVAVGDRVLYYHTGGEKAIVGEAVVTAGPRPDPAGDDSAAVVVDIAPARRFARPVTLTVLKADAVWGGSELARLPRLSVVPVTPEQFVRAVQLGAGLAD